MMSPHHDLHRRLPLFHDARSIGTARPDGNLQRRNRTGEPRHQERHALFKVAGEVFTNLGEDYSLRT